MTNNDVLRSLRYILNIPNSKVIEIINLGHSGATSISSGPAAAPVTVTDKEIETYLKKEDEPGYVECPHQVMAQFLNGMILFKRGKSDAKPLRPLELPVTNNMTLKKIRVAFELKDDDILALIKKNGLDVSKREFSAFFRKVGHRNYRECGDQFLRNMLRGMRES